MTDVILNQNRNATLRLSTKNPITKQYVNITGALLTFQIKRTPDVSGIVLVEKQNATAGGSDSEIEDTDLTSGVYRVFLSPSDVSGAGEYWCETKMVLQGASATIFGPKRLKVTNVVIL